MDECTSRSTRLYKVNSKSFIFMFQFSPEGLFLVSCFTFSSRREVRVGWLVDKKTKNKKQKTHQSWNRETNEPGTYTTSLLFTPPHLFLFFISLRELKWKPSPHFSLSSFCVGLKPCLMFPATVPPNEWQWMHNCLNLCAGQVALRWYKWQTPQNDGIFRNDFISTRHLLSKMLIANAHASVPADMKADKI